MEKQSLKDNVPSPYLNARREWEERYGGYVSAATTWRVATFGSLIIAMISTAGAIYLANQQTVIPYIVEINRHGLVQQVRQASDTDKVTQDRIITALLAEFVGLVRNVVVDARVQRNNVMKVYVYLQKNSPAFTKITQYFGKNDPFKRARKNTVFVEVIRILPLKNSAYQIEWKETIMDRSTGQTNEVLKYKIIIYTTLTAPSGEADIIRNPIGLIINDFNWSKEI